MTDKEEIKVLKEKLGEYEEILQKVLAEPKVLGRVVAGPLTIPGEPGFTYRVEVDNGKTVLAGYAQSVAFGKKRREEISIGAEVTLIAGAIVAVTPEELIIKEKTPEFNLVSWDEIGGLKSQIQTIRETVETPLQHADLAEELGLSPMKGVLLYGPPGCGKTLIAKAIASTILKSKKVDQRAFVYVKGGEMLSQYVGATEQRIASMFKSCRDYSEKTGTRAVIFIDEAEAILPRRGSRRSSDVEKTIVPTFLAEMDGFDCHSPFVLLATNYPDQIDDAILREGRIDIRVGIERPTEEDAKEIFEIHLDKVKCIDDKALLAELGSRLIFAHDTAKTRISGSLIETVVKLSTQKALARKIADKKSKTGVIQEDLHKAIESIN